jgi:hypothetical protein
VRAGNRYGRANVGRTLGQLTASKIALVAICRRCKHRRVLFAANYVPRFGEDYPAIEVRKHLRCSNCRGRVVNLHEASR